MTPIVMPTPGCRSDSRSTPTGSTYAPPRRSMRTPSAELVMVGTHDWEDALARVNGIVSHDPSNPGLQLAYAARLYLNAPSILHGLDLIPSADSVDFVIEKDGARKTYRMAPTASVGAWYFNSIPTAWVDARSRSIPTPLAMQHPERFYWYVVRPEEHAIYVQFNVVGDADSESLAAFADRLRVDMARPAVTRVVIDVRANTGGDNTLLRPLLLALIRSKLNHRGGMYCLIGPTTFSAAQNFVNRLESYTETIFVGEPTGANVNSYGDPTSIELPHSHLKAEASTLWWQDMPPTDTRTAMFPEIAVTSTFADYSAGRDPALRLALNGAAPETIEEVVERGIALGPDSALARYHAYASDPLHRYAPDPELRLYNLGYTLINAKRPRDAVVVFQVNARAHPRSVYEYDGLGDAYLAAADTTHALAAYRQALDANASDPKAIRMTTRLTATARQQ